MSYRIVSVILIALGCSGIAEYHSRGDIKYPKFAGWFYINKALNSSPSPHVFNVFNNREFHLYRFTVNIHFKDNSVINVDKTNYVVQRKKIDKSFETFGVEKIYYSAYQQLLGTSVIYGWTQEGTSFEVLRDKALRYGFCWPGAKSLNIVGTILDQAKELSSKPKNQVGYSISC